MQKLIFPIVLSVLFAFSACSGNIAGQAANQGDMDGLNEGSNEEEVVLTPVAANAQSCFGCYFDGECLDLGTPIESFGKKMYCSGEVFVEFKKGGSQCTESYECKSTTCEEGFCKRNFWEMILAPFST